MALPASSIFDAGTKDDFSSSMKYDFRNGEKVLREYSSCGQ
jgi:hypothetical protein